MHFFIQSKKRSNQNSTEKLQVEEYDQPQKII